MLLGLLPRLHLGNGAASHVGLDRDLRRELLPVAEDRHEASDHVLERVHVVVEEDDLRVPSETVAEPVVRNDDGLFRLG